MLQSAPPDATRESFGPLRHMVFVLVNAATSPETAWEAIDTAPALFDIIDQTTTVQINRYTIETIELLPPVAGEGAPALHRARGAGTRAGSRVR